jgi:cytoskeletal protein CcmA (bactofilin family)
LSSHTSTSDSGVWSFDSSAGPSSRSSALPAREQKKEASPASSSFDTVVGRECQLKGNFHFRGKTQLEGVIEGEISSDGDLYIGEGADIKATVQGERVHVFGRLIGDVVCSERLELFAGARVSGNIASPRLVVHDGVVFDGFCRMEEKVANLQENQPDNVVDLCSNS